VLFAADADALLWLLGVAMAVSVSPSWLLCRSRWKNNELSILQKDAC
jgi:hypothetical protein